MHTYSSDVTMYLIGFTGFGLEHADMSNKNLHKKIILQLDFTILIEEADIYQRNILKLNKEGLSGKIINGGCFSV